MENISKSVKNTLKIEGETILNLEKQIDMDIVEKIVDILANLKGRVVVSGCGTSGVVAKKIVHTLNCVECAASFLSPADAVHGGLGVLREGDVAILLSKGGSTTEITQLLPSCQKKGATIIGITENEDSVLAQNSDIVLKIHVEKEPDKFNMLATASILAVIAVMDAIAICVMDRNGFTREKFAIIHPSGAVGERLLSATDLA